MHTVPLRSAAPRPAH